MKKRMMLFAAVAMILTSTAQNTFAEEETGGIRKIADMITEARRITEGTEMFSASMTLGDTEVSAGMTIRMTPDSASVDMLYLSAPNGDGTFFDFVSEDVLRIFGTKAYLNTESIKEMISELTEENRIDEEKGENVLQAADSLTEDWIGLVGHSMNQDDFTYDGWTWLFSGLAAAHDAGSYTINLKNDQIGQLLGRLDMQTEQGQLDKTFVIDWEPLLTPYVDAVIEGMKEADPENAFDQDKKKKQIFDMLQTIFCPDEDDEKEPLAVQFENAVSKGLEVNVSICAGKDGAAGTYAFEVTIEAEISDQLQKEWGIEELSKVVGETEGLLTQTDELDIKNALFNFVVSIEPAEEPIEIEEPEDGILWMTDLLREWAAQGLILQ
ncbi:MAG: hypothetical protein ACLSGO_00095 [Lachnospiraceae bacterium]